MMNAKERYVDRNLEYAGGATREDRRATIERSLERIAAEPKEVNIAKARRLLDKVRASIKGWQLATQAEASSSPMKDSPELLTEAGDPSSVLRDIEFSTAYLDMVSEIAIAAKLTYDELGTTQEELNYLNGQAVELEHASRKKRGI